MEIGMNTYLQAILQHTRSYLISLSILLCATSLYPMTPKIPVGMPQLSPQEQKQLEAEMTAFQEEFNKLSPQEQESFYQSMEEAVQKIEELSQTEEGKALLDKLDKGEISDEELDTLINQLVGEETKEEAPKEPEIEVEEPKPAPKPSVVLSSKEAQAIDMISTLILQTDSFLVKVATIPEFSGNIRQWTKKGTVSWIGTIQNWPDLKKDIEKMVTLLSELLEQNKKTGAYYHIDEFLKNETLYNNMRKVQTVVAEYEPKVQEASPLHKINKSSKNALQKLLNQYIEALYVLKIPEEITALIKKFDPKAHAAREGEEKAIKEAELAAKREPRAPGRPIVAGAAEEPMMYTPLYDSYPEYKAPRTTPRTFIPEAPSRAYAPPPPAPISAPSRGKTPSIPSGKGQNEKEPEKKEEESGIPKEYRERVAALDKKRQEEIDRLTNRVTDMIASIAKELAGAPSLKILEKHLGDETPVDIELVTEIIPDTQRELSSRRGIQGKMNELREKTRSPRARKASQATLKKEYEKHKKTFEEVDRNITAIEQKFDTLQKSIPADKLYAYFGIQSELPEPEKAELSYGDVEKKLNEIAKETKTEEEALDKAVHYLESSLAESEKYVSVQKELTEAAAKPLREIERKVPNPISLFELRNSLRELKKSIDEFDKGPVTKH
jgi:hypothetical protein